jgi:hypothetical protein
MSSDEYIFPTKAAEEVAIRDFAKIAARRARQAFKMARIDADDLPATDIYDECRDHAYDVLRSHGGEALVDLLLLDVADAAASLIMGS